jgi:hypothetical protein
MSETQALLLRRSAGLTRNARRASAKNAVYDSPTPFLRIYGFHKLLF